jgi:DNA phosphorothioation-associated putative methyltransferase
VSSPPVARHRTAIKRSDLSRPIRVARNDGLVSREVSVFDYGCGHGDDVRLLKSLGINSQGWDPVYRPTAERVRSDVVNLGYVINVIESTEERAASIREAWSLAEEVLIVSARLTHESTPDRQTAFEDGCLTRRQTFQKYYEQSELRDWIDQVLGVSSVAAAPGIFYVFRDAEARQSFVAARFRRPIVAPKLRRSEITFEQHKPLLVPLMHFITVRGRLPEESELAVASTIRDKLGSLSRAFAIIRRVSGAEQWETIREERGQDLLVYLALARFGGRPRFSQLPRELQLDVRAFFSTYNRACALADKLLFSAGNLDEVDKTAKSSRVGKLLPTSLYVHISAIPGLSPLMRVYEGCARALIGSVEGANIIKLHLDGPRVSYLSYPNFEREPHPALSGSLLVDLQTFRVKYREYTDSDNPPILHRKEEFVASSHPLRGRFTRLTRQEEKYCLYDEIRSIGTREGWAKVLKDRGVQLSGHRIVSSGRVNARLADVTGSAPRTGSVTERLSKRQPSH